MENPVAASVATRHACGLSPSFQGTLIMIVVCGEALMDVFDNGATASGQALDARIGGSPYNVALGLARLGQPVAFCGGIANGFLGRRLMQSLADEGIDTSCVQRVDAPTSVCIVGRYPAPASPGWH